MELACHVRYQMHDMGVALYPHQLIYPDPSNLRHPPQIIPSQIDQHDMLGLFFLIIHEFPFQSLVLFFRGPPPTGSSNGTEFHPTVLPPNHDLR